MMKVVTHHGIAADIDREDRCKVLEAKANSLHSIAVVVASRGINAVKKCPTDTAREAMINSDFAAGDDLATWVRGHWDGSPSRHWQTAKGSVRTISSVQEYRRASALSILASSAVKKVSVLLCRQGRAAALLRFVPPLQGERQGCPGSGVRRRLRASPARAGRRVGGGVHRRVACQEVRRLRKA
jgi:hypothetical protein